MTTSDDSSASGPTETTDEEKNATSPDVAASTDEEPLPETIERTPEYAEEEAVRGDFVLRWAVILLAFMLGFSQTDSVPALVHAKSGEYMQSNGFIPPRTDVFSYTAQGQSWIQLSWLFDHVSAGIHAIFGASGFTFLTAIIAAVGFGFAVHTSMPRVSTWWSVICLGLALLACYPRFTPTPEILTLGFLALTLAWLHGWQQQTKDGFPWRIPILIFLWANMDPRAWLGVLLIVLYGLGHAIDRLIGRNGWTPKTRTKQLGLLIGSCVLAACLNPFLWQSLTEPARQYGNEYPAARSYLPLTERNAADAPESRIQYYGLSDPNVWTRGHHTTWAGTVVLLLAITMFLVNAANIDVGFLLVQLGFTTLAVLASHELAAAALVSAVLAGLNGQDWFRRTFSAEYSTGLMATVFSQGGRAVTVLALCLVGLLAVSGHLTGAEGTRIGVGLDPNLNAAVNAMEEDLRDIDKDSRLFNFTPEQGGLLVWLGHRSFVDTRYTVFHRARPDLIREHQETRRSLRFDSDGNPGDERVWGKAVADHKIDYLVARLYGARPGYLTYFDLLSNAKWRLKSLGGAAALFRPAEENEPVRLDFARAGVRTTEEEPANRLDWAEEPGFYDKYLFVPKKVHRNDAQMARHYHEHFVPLAQRRGYEGDLIGIAYLTIRHANQALVIEPNNSSAYRYLGDAQGILFALESQFGSEFGSDTPKEERQSLQIGAWVQAIRCAKPANRFERGEVRRLHLSLAAAYGARQRPELQLRALGNYLKLADAAEALDELPREEKQSLAATRRQHDVLSERLTTLIEQITKMREEEAARRRAQQVASGQPPDPSAAAQELFEYAQALTSRGYTITALGVLGTDPDLVRDAPPARLLWGQLLMEDGQYFEAWTVLGGISEVHRSHAEQLRGINWFSDAALCAMIQGNYAAANDIWRRQLRSMEDDSRQIESDTLQTPLFLPMTTRPDTWPDMQTATLSTVLLQIPADTARARFMQGMCLLEQGKPRSASQGFKALVDQSPTSGYAPLASYYHQLINDQEADFRFEMEWIPLDLEEALRKEKEARTEDGKPAAGAEPQSGDADG